MMKFILYVSFFLAIIILLFSTVTYITDRGLRKSEFGNMKEWRDIFDKKIHADIVIQGSSRAWVQFDTYILDSVLNANSYNMGMDGTPFDVQYVKYMSYVENNKYPKVILQNVDWDTMDKNTPVFQKYQLVPFLGNASFKERLLSNKILTKSDIYFPFLKYAGEPKALQVGISEFFGVQHFSSLKHKGFLGVDAKWNGSNFEKRKKSGKNHWHRNTEVEKLFINFLLDCKRKNIKVVLVFAPCYYENAGLIDDFEGLKTYYSDIAKRNKVDFWDYSLDSISYSKDNFYNASHLNKKGAEAFTLKLANQLRNLKVI